MKITELVAFVRLNIDSLRDGVSQAKTLNNQMRVSFADTAKSIDTALTRVSAVVAGIGTAAATMYGRFELTMKRAGAVTNTLGTRDFALLEAAAKKMGEETVYSAQEAAAAIEQMGLAGLTTQEIIQALPGALQLASSAQISIAQAADVAAKTMRAFGASAEELAHINDVLVATFTRSNTDITQLGEAMKYVAPVSNALGVSIEDTAAIIAKLGDAGFQGSMAGTSLRNIMSTLAGATPAATAKLNELGIVTVDASGKMLPLIDVLRQIEQSAITDAKVLEIFGARGGPQLLALLEVGIDAVEEFSGKLSEAGGTAQRISDANLDSLWGMLKIVQSAVEAVALEVGQSMAPSIRAAGQTITDMIQQSRPQLVEMGKDLFKLVISGFQELFELLRDHGPAMLDAAKSWGAFLKPIAEFLIANPSLVAAFVAFKTTGLLGVNSALINTTQLMMQTIGQMKLFPSTMGGVASAFRSGWASAVAETARAQQAVAAFVPTARQAEVVVDAVWESVNRANTGFTQWRPAIAAAGPAMQGLTYQTQAAVSGFLGYSGAISRVTQGVGTGLIPSLNNTRSRIIDSTATVVGATSNMRSFAQGILSSVMPALQNMGTQLRGLAAGGVAGMTAAVRSLATGALQSLVSSLRLVGQALQSIGFAVAVAAIAHFAQKIYESNQHLRQLKENLAISAKLDEDVERARQRRRTATIAQMNQLNTAEERRVFLAEQLALAEKNRAGAAMSEKGARQKVTDAGRLPEILGDKVLEGFKLEAEAASRREREEAAWIDQLKTELALLDAQGAAIDGRAGAGAGPAIGEGAATEMLNNANDIGAAIGSSAGDSIEKQIQDAQKAATEEAMPGIGKLRDFTNQEGVTSQQIEQFAGLVEGATPEMAKQLAQQLKNANGNQDLASFATYDFQKQANANAQQNERLDQASQDSLSYTIDGDPTAQFHQQILNLQARLVSLQDAFISGAITEQQYEEGLRTLQSEMTNAARAQQEQLNAILQSDVALQDFKQKMGETFGAGGLQAIQPIFDGFRTRLDALQQQLRNGEISADGFKRAVADLNREADKAAMRERNKLLASGQFAAAGLNFQDAVLERMAQARLSQWNSYIDQYANGLMGLTSAMQPVTQQFGMLQQNMQQFGASLQGAAGGGNASQAWGQISQMLNSADGQIAALRNNISLLQQNLSVVDSDRRRAEITSQIEAMQAQLSDLTVPQQPVFVSSQSDDLSSGSTQYRVGSNSLSVTVSLPNATRYDAESAREITDLVVDELTRQGRAVYR